MTSKPDYIEQIDEVALELQNATIPIEKRILEAWERYEKLAQDLHPSYDILSSMSGFCTSFREHSRMLIALLYEVHPGSAVADCEQIRAKDKAYGGSWHRRGGTGAFHALARKGDRIVEQFRLYGTIERARLEDKTESIDDTLGDLRRYLILVEAWHVARERARMEPKLSAEGQKAYDELMQKFSGQVGEEHCVSCGHLKNNHYDLSSESIYCGISGCRCTGYQEDVPL